MQPVGVLLSYLLLESEGYIEKDEHEDLLESNTTHVDVKSFRYDQQDNYGHVWWLLILLTK